MSVISCISVILLSVVDVYSDWCGPCIGMVGNLKKIKVEIGGDNLHLAVVSAFTLTAHIFLDV